MNTIYRLLAAGVLFLWANVGLADEPRPEFLRESRFSSTDDFVSRAKQFKPAQEKGYWGYLFSPYTTASTFKLEGRRLVHFEED